MSKRILLSQHAELNLYSSWKDCSRDSTCNESMISSDCQVINFDKVKTHYLNALGKTEECAASVDAVCRDRDEHIYIIEFKNGKIDKDNIRKKVTESLLILTDITNCSLSSTREHVDFILVYNPDSINLSPVERREISLARLGKTPCQKFGLDKLQGYCVARAYMMTAREFTNRLSDDLACISKIR